MKKYLETYYFIIMLKNKIKKKDPGREVNCMGR